MINLRIHRVPCKGKSARQLLAFCMVGALLLLAGCSMSMKQAKPNATADESAPTGPQVTISSNVKDGDVSVPLGQRVRVAVEHGSIESVSLTRGAGVKQLPGTTGADGLTWVSRSHLTPGATYALNVKAVSDEGNVKTLESAFTTQDLSKDQQTFPSFFPTSGSTVGVGMPVIIKFDLPVRNKKRFENNISVVTAPVQEGGLRWISDNELRWRPAKFWHAGTKVTVKANVGGVPAGNGIFGQTDRTLRFNIGRSLISRVNIETHQMRVFKNGKLINTIPITTGRQPEHTTRSGVKLIMEKYRTKDMNSETIGIDPDSADGYDLSGVEFAQRITSSGEFIHAAPWSVGSQGHANVSHGCTGMSTSNAGWLYGQTIIGDPVIYTGSNRPMTLTNGYGDWNVSFADYIAGR